MCRWVGGVAGVPRCWGARAGVPQEPHEGHRAWNTMPEWGEQQEAGLEGDTGGTGTWDEI